MPELRVGDMAPDFTLPATVGDKVSLSDYRGKKNVVLLFYPLDFSPVCSAENRECAQLAPGLASDDVAVLGVSVDSLWSHRAFAEKFGISYPLLSDFHPKGEVAKKYGVFLEDRGMAARTAFVIGKDGKILDIVKSDVPVARDIAALLEKARAA
ncbi:MAG: peroxiredoxin [Acidobacteria bacterium]|nr:MAG: peroxiredoxin [Acidobacteriota bacterium]PYQ68137.1 MAG: peroxiredoxin [Acidobacteriota bacterium]